MSSFCWPGRWAGLCGVYEYGLLVVSARQAGECGVYEKWLLVVSAGQLGGQVSVEFMSIVYE